MSSATQPDAPARDDRPLKVVIVSHSPLFYWWPVWAVGFLMAGLSYWFGDLVAFVPPGTEAKKDQQVEGIEGPRDVLVAPKGESLPATATDDDDLKQPRLRMFSSNSYGIIWALTLCLVIVVTHVPFRGVWSLVALIIVVATVVVLAVMRLWDPILALQVVDIHITAYSYLAISLFLFVLWLLTFGLFDRFVYMVFSRGQLRVRTAISLGETVYDTRGMVVERHRDDLFRHWLLGFGSGDLTVKTSGVSGRQLEMPNVLFIGRKLRLIHTMLQEGEVVRGSR